MQAGIGLDLLATAVPLVLGGFLAGLFTYIFERRLNAQDRRERKGVLLESLKRELGFIPSELPAYRAGVVSFLPPIRTAAGNQLLDGHTLDWKSDEPTIQALLELLGAASIYNALAMHLNGSSSNASLSDDARRHWHGQMLGAHASVLGVRRQLLALIAPTAAAPKVDGSTAGLDAGLEAPHSSTWTIDAAHSGVRFSARHMGITDVHGRFASARVLLDLDPGDLTTASVEVVINAESIDTGEPRRDADLRSERFLHAAQYPHLTFISTSVSRRDQRHYDLYGDLTIRDVSRPITLSLVSEAAIRTPNGAQRVSFAATTTIKRSDWGLTWNLPLEAGGWLISDEVNIDVTIQAVRTPALAEAMVVAAASAAN